MTRRSWRDLIADGKLISFEEVLSNYLALAIPQAEAQFRALLDRAVDDLELLERIHLFLEAEGEENVSHQLRGVADDVPEHESPNPGDHRP